MRKCLCLLLCLCVLVSLSGCTATARTPGTRVSVTLPPVVSHYEAPQDDSDLTKQSIVALYLPSRDGQRLLAQYAELPLRAGVSAAETVVRTLLAFPANADVTSLGGNVTIGLFGSHPVEVSGSVCTVNLSASTLQLDYDQRYTLFLALASTLGGVGDIRFVNVLIADQAASLDISGNLAAGSVTAHPGEELPVLWDQMDARRTPLGNDPAQQLLTSVATLYFPLADGSGFVPEARNLTFPGQTARQMTRGLLEALSAGAQFTEGTVQMPDVDGLMTQEPDVSELADGGRMVTLHFSSDLGARLSLIGLDVEAFVGSLAYTIMSYVPAVGAVRMYSGPTLITSLGSRSFADGVQRRRQYQDLLMDQTTIYLSSGDRLVPVLRSLPADAADDPRSLLALMMLGANETEQAAGIRSTLPAGMDASDVLGVSIVGDTMLLNLSPRFERLIRQAGPDTERQLCYSMVSTLCRAMGLRRVQFFFDGQMPDTLGGSLSWSGEFLLNNALIDQNLG